MTGSLRLRARIWAIEKLGGDAEHLYWRLDGPVPSDSLMSRTLAEMYLPEIQRQLNAALSEIYRA